MADNLYTAVIKALTFKEDIDEDEIKRKATELAKDIHAKETITEILEGSYNNGSNSHN